MNTKILSFKFTKKSAEPLERNCNLKKKYENIFNEILNGRKINEISDNSIKKEFIKEKKNTIKCISKISYMKSTNVKSLNIKNLNEENKNIELNKKNNPIKEIYKMENYLNEEMQISQNNGYVNNSNVIIKNNLNIILSQKLNINQNNINNTVIPVKNSCFKGNKILNIKKIYKKIKPSMKFNKNNNNKIKDKKREELSIKKEKNQSSVVDDLKKYELSQMKYNALIINKLNIMNKRGALTQRKENKHKIINYDKKKTKGLESFKIKSLIYINSKKKNNQQNFSNKITITNDNINENIKLKKNLNNCNYTLNNDTKRKKLIFKNTNSNINININITNINDKNIINKNSNFSKENKNSNTFSDKNNFNNIATVNIINNSNNKKLSDYNLFFNNHSNKKIPYIENINYPKGIKIREININLGEGKDNNNFNQNNFKDNLIEKEYKNNNLINDNFFKIKELENDKKESQSEYEYLYDYEDFSSNRSITNFSCKSGFTASR